MAEAGTSPDKSPNVPADGVVAPSEPDLGSTRVEVAPPAPSAPAARAALSDEIATAVTGQPEAVTEPEELHTDFVERQKKIDAQTAQADVATLKGETVEEIRYNSRLLKKKEGDETPEAQVANLEEETARRIKAYTSGSGDGWFKLNYAKFGADKHGLTHELYVGLGDILLDPDIKDVSIDQDGRIIKAHRGIVSSGKHAGRVAFLNDKNDYVATYTGDKFKILSSDQMAQVEYGTKVQEEDIARAKNRDVFKDSVVKFAVSENPVTMKPDVKLQGAYKVDGNDVSVEVTNTTIDAAAAECADKTEISEAVKRENLMKVLHYIAAKADVPASAMLAILHRENGVQFPGGIGDKGQAVGMGQFHLESWSDQKKDKVFRELVGQVITEDPGEAGRGVNIFVDLVGVAVCLKKAGGVFGIDVHSGTDITELEGKITAPDGTEMSALSWMRMYYHVPGYAHVYASFIKKGESGLSERYKRLLPEAHAWLGEHKDEYNAYSRQTVAANDAIVAQERTA